MIAVIAIGNGGCNISDSIRKQCNRLCDAKFIFCDTNANDLYQHGQNGDKFIVLKQGDEFFPDVISPDITSVLIIATLGGETGNKFSQLAAQRAKKVGVQLVTALVSMPFTFEGEDKCAKAQYAGAELSELCDKTIIHNNENFLSAYPEHNFLTAFEYADKTLLKSVNEHIKR